MVEGAAGSGKTTMLATAIEALDHAGPVTGRVDTGPPEDARHARGEWVIVDEAGMLDRDTALVLLTVIREARASVALIGDRAQLPAVGRGGVLEAAAHIRGATVDMSELHHFDDDQ